MKEKQMGLQRSEGGNAILLTIANGMLCQKIEKDAPPQVGESTREVEIDGVKEIRREQRYRTLVGKLAGGSLDKTDYGIKLRFHMTDNGEKYTISIPYGGRAFGEITKRIPNLDINKETLIGVGTDKEKDRTFIYIKQKNDNDEWENISFAFTKDNTNGLPKAVQDKKTDEWDFKKQNDFLYDIADEYFKKFDGISAEDIAAEFGGEVKDD